MVAGENILGQGRLRREIDWLVQADLDRRIAEHGLQGGFGLGGGLAGDQAALHRGVGAGRQGAFPLPGAQHGGHACGAQEGVDHRIAAEAVHGRPGRRPGQGLHVGADGVLVQLAELAKIAAGGLGQVQGEAVGGQLLQAGGQLVDGIVGARQGRVAAPVGDFQFVGGVGLFAGLDAHVVGHAVLPHRAIAIGVEGEAGVHQIAVGGEQPLNAVGVAAAFLVGGEGGDDVTVRDEALPLHADQGGEHQGVVALHVLGSAGVVVAVLLDELEGIGGPVAGVGLDHVQVADEQQRLAQALAVQADNDVALGGVVGGGEHVHIGGSETRGQGAPGHRLGGDR